MQYMSQSKIKFYWISSHAQQQIIDTTTTSNENNAGKREWMDEQTFMGPPVGPGACREHGSEQCGSNGCVVRQHWFHDAAHHRRRPMPEILKYGGRGRGSRRWRNLGRRTNMVAEVEAHEGEAIWDSKLTRYGMADERGAAGKAQALALEAEAVCGC